MAAVDADQNGETSCSFLLQQLQAISIIVHVEFIV